MIQRGWPRRQRYVTSAHAGAKQGRQLGAEADKLGESLTKFKVGQGGRGAKAAGQCSEEDGAPQWIHTAPAWRRRC